MTGGSMPGILGSFFYLRIRECNVRSRLVELNRSAVGAGSTRICFALIKDWISRSVRIISHVSVELRGTQTRQLPEKASRGNSISTRFASPWICPAER